MYAIGYAVKEDQQRRVACRSTITIKSSASVKPFVIHGRTVDFVTQNHFTTLTVHTAVPTAATHRLVTRAAAVSGQEKRRAAAATAAADPRQACTGNTKACSELMAHWPGMCTDLPAFCTTLVERVADDEGVFEVRLPSCKSEPLLCDSLLLSVDDACAAAPEICDVMFAEAIADGLFDFSN